MERMNKSRKVEGTRTVLTLSAPDGASWLSRKPIRRFLDYILSANPFFPSLSVATQTVPRAHIHDAWHVCITNRVKAQQQHFAARQWRAEENGRKRIAFLIARFFFFFPSRRRLYFLRSTPYNIAFMFYVYLYIVETRERKKRQQQAERESVSIVLSGAVSHIHRPFFLFFRFLILSQKPRDLFSLITL